MYLSICVYIYLCMYVFQYLYTYNIDPTRSVTTVGGGWGNMRSILMGRAVAPCRMSPWSSMIASVILGSCMMRQIRAVSGTVPLGMTSSPSSTFRKVDLPMQEAQAVRKKGTALHVPFQHN